MEVYRIVIDAMGGDYAPEEIIKGAVRAAMESETLYCLFVGDEVQIRKYLDEYHLPSNRYEIVHCTEVIGMEESPREAVENKPDASINVAARLIRDNKGDALVSAGSTGATVMACSREIPRMGGIERAAFAAVLPSAKEGSTDPGFTIMLDVGATIHCTPNQLASFAIMGTHYAREVMGISNPTVGLLNIGEEETKGHGTLIETYQLLKQMEVVQFSGNVEGKDIMRGSVDVIVTEGITGNIVLKALEGFAELMMGTLKQIWKKGVFPKMGIAMLTPTLRRLKKRLDYSEYGGAPLLGFQKLIIKAHGRSKAKAIKNAVLLAEKSVEHQLVEKIESSMKEFYLRMFEHQPQDEK
ncbi:MAG: phosphate acyltransferase PlsX [Calditrichaeota bacterium]|nr:MAG: phosphate acyltransferase PlsX [Calditrichota bacterium]